MVGRSPKLDRLLLWSLGAATLLIGVALAVTVLTTNLAVSRASDVLIRGQGDVIFDGIRLRIRELTTLPSESFLEELIDEYRDDGLRYLALLKDNRVVVDAGDPLPDSRLTESWLDRMEPSEPVQVGNRVRMVFGTRRPPGNFRNPLLIEFRPLVADRLRSSAASTFGIGIAAASVFFLVALGLGWWALKREAMARARDHERRLASLGEMSAVLAHEIRNPLAALKGHAQLMVEMMDRDGHPPDKARRIVKEAARLESLTSRLLEFARAGEIRRVPADPAALLRDSAERAGAKGIRIDCNGAPSSWPLDPDRIRQVLGNLLENALQGDSDEPVEAAVKSDNGDLVFVVRDRGNGISEGCEEKIFEPFHTERANGTGLGHAVARRLVELHQGEIRARNRKSGGAEFMVRIPSGEGS